MINLQKRSYEIIAIGNNFDLLHDKATGYVYKRTQSRCALYRKIDGNPLTYIEFKGFIKRIRQGEKL